MRITDLTGVRTRSSVDLLIRKGQGLGGKALVLGRPLSVPSYLSAEGITHEYDHAVRPEAMETVAALPIIVDRVPRVLIFLASRTHVGLGERFFDSFIPMIRRFERDIAVEDEVTRRLNLIRAAGPEERSTLTRRDLEEITLELTHLAGQIHDESLRARIDVIGHRFSTALTPRTSCTASAGLRRREIDVLEQVAQGLSNREIADVLGLQPDTVKSYLKNAMRKLHVSNRVQAILAARQRGIVH